MSNNSNGGDSNAETVVAVVALVVSIIAFLATFMQVLQQYFASAAGYSQCSEKVMGDWAKSKSRKFSWQELRFEVEFDAPVIFVSPPQNEKGAIPNQPIFYLDGSDKSLKETCTVSSMDSRKEYVERSEKDRIHTADNERASWVVLLYAVQRMEKTSSEWQRKQYGPPGDLCVKYGLPEQPPSLREHHTLTVALQRKRKSWDTMPASVTKPYATTTICHLIEMLAALGVYWKEFDRRKDRYWAEGNGFLVLGERLSDLGLMFSFQTYGQCYFEKNRVIPVDDIKELCFGYVPTIYREKSDHRRLTVPTEMPGNLGSLQMATRREVAESLTLIGCNNNTVNQFLEDGTRTSHLFPVTFEILGMMSQNFHINNSSFTFIPNPTPDRWDRRSLSLIHIMEAYRAQFERDLPGVRRNVSIVNLLRSHVDEIVSNYSEQDGVDRLLCLRILHVAIKDADEILTAKSKPSISANGRTTAADLVTDEATLGQHQHERRELVQDVLRSHFQEVLRLLNERDDRNFDGQSLHPDRVPGTPRMSRSFDYAPRPPAPRFEDMDNASPDERQHKFMDVYFEVIRPKVVRSAKYSRERRASIASVRGDLGYPNHAGDYTPRSGSSRNGSRTRVSLDEAAISDNDTPISPSDMRRLRRDGDAEDDQQNTANHSKRIRSEANILLPLAAQPVSHDDIWCTLVFRMICWLMLHDFNKQDVQVSKGELLGSRMPVYVS